MRLDHLLSKDKELRIGLVSLERSCGALAQLGERLLCTQEVSGSIPLVSISARNSREFCSLKTEYYITTNNQLIYRELE